MKTENSRIHIENIAVQNLGPIRRFNHDFSGITLVYGGNEKGKTYLVEFMIQSLYKNRQGFSFRDTGAQGIIQVSGL